MEQPSRTLRDSAEDREADTKVFPAPAAPPSNQPESLAPPLASSDQCANCGSPLAPDQHYCLVCGERRGPARFSSLPATAGATTTVLTEERAGPRPPRFPAAATLIAGVATLLIAMGIGVYIGGLGKNNNSAGQRVPIVTVNGGAAAPAGSTASTGSNAAATGSGSHTGKSKGTGKSASKAVTTVKNLPPPTVTVGAKGHGKGYQGGKFTGHFFGP